MLPTLSLTLGDPAGIGPEIVVKALADPSWHGVLQPVVVGDIDVIHQAAAGCGLDLPLHAVGGPHDIAGDPGIVYVVDCGVLRAPRHGVVDADHGRAALTYIERACELVRQRHVDGLVTGPISKEAIWAAGAKFPGHTELLADLFGVAQNKVMTMFVLSEYKIFFLTRHLSLREAIGSLTVDGTVYALTQVHAHMRSLGVRSPRLALPALNPHAGENGNLGREEIDILVPAVEQARQLGIDVAGPVPSDAVFFHARKGRYDAVLSLFHDQGHIAAKTVDFFGTVACELGLPVIRTSVDHGTAFDIAGRWVADASGQIAAMRTAAALASALQASA
jgi:4-hydroxythreonine-4-phosphate dehydrogenase